MRTTLPPINQPIQVMLDKSNHMPRSFEWQGRIYRVSSIQEYWRLLDAWWDGLGEKTFFRIECTNRAVFEIMYDHMNKQWLISRVED